MLVPPLRKAQMLMELWHLKAAYISFGFAALTLLLLIVAWARDGSPVGPALL